MLKTIGTMRGLVHLSTIIILQNNLYFTHILLITKTTQSIKTYAKNGAFTRQTQQSTLTQQLYIHPEP